MADIDVKDPPSPDSPEHGDSSEHEDDTSGTTGNVFRNDGSFLEMFKRLQEGKTQQGANANDQKCDVTSGVSSKSASTIPQPKKPPLSFVGKRRGGRILATGMVKKPRKETDNNKSENSSNSSSNSNSGGGSGKTDAWSQYMNEVKKYREQSCEEEDKRRPLVK